MRKIFLLVLLCINELVSATTNHSNKRERIQGLDELISATFNNSNKKGKIHALIVADTNDYGIGRSVKIDVENIEKSLDTIGAGINFEVCSATLEGRSCSFNDVSDELKKLNTTSKDIIVFYYSGHGFNNPKLETCWPVLRTKSKRIPGKNIIDCLKTKKKRLAIILFDCCNTFPEKEKRVLDLKRSERPFFLKKSHNLKAFFRLLLLSKGIIVSSASCVGTPATCETAWGGTFTRGFLKAVCELGIDESATWEKIFNLTVEKTVKISRDTFYFEQCPIYSIEVDK